MASIPSRLSETDLELLHKIYMCGGMARSDQPSDLMRAGDRCAAAGLLLCEKEEVSYHGKYLGVRRGIVWYYDSEHIAAHAVPGLLAQVRADMPYWGDPYPPKQLSEPRRGHLKVVDEQFEPDQTSPG